MLDNFIILASLLSVQSSRGAGISWKAFAAFPLFYPRITRIHAKDFASLSRSYWREPAGISHWRDMMGGRVESIFIR